MCPGHSGQAGKPQSDGAMNTREAASVHSGDRDSGKGTGGTSVDEGQTEVTGISRIEVEWRQCGNGV